MSKKQKIGSYLYSCLTQEQKEGFNRVFDRNDMDLDNPPLIVGPFRKEHGWKDAIEVKIELIFGVTG